MTPVCSQARLFFIAAIAYTVTWTALSSELSRLSLLYGPGILLQCNLAYFIPSIPILALQFLFDEWADARFGKFRSNCWRAVVGFGGGTVVAATLPFQPQSSTWLLASVAATGLANGIAFGSMSQAAACQPAEDTMALVLGYVASGPVVLVIESALRMGPQPAQWQVAALYAAVALISAGGLAAALVVHSRIWRRQLLQGPAARPRWGQPANQGSGSVASAVSDAEWGKSALLEPLLALGKGGPEDDASMVEACTECEAPEQPWEQGQHQQQPGEQVQEQQLGGGGDGCSSEGCGGSQGPALRLEDQDEAWGASYFGEGAAGPARLAPAGAAVYWEVGVRIWLVAVAVFLSVGTSMLLFPFFPFVPSTCLGLTLPTVLFWGRVFSDIGGRLLPRLYALASPAGLLALSALKLAATPLLFLYIHSFGKLPVLGGAAGDAAALAFVCFQWLLSGYLNSCCYLSAPRQVPAGLGTKAAAAMTLVFQAGCLGGLLFAIPAKQWLPGP